MAKTGRVLSIHGQRIIVDSEGEQYSCVLRGSLKQEASSKKNLVIVGDLVGFSPSGEREGVISEINQRYSLLSRTTPRSRKQHLIAANIDQVLITVSVSHPTLKPSLIDRYLIAAEKGNMQPVIVINKSDLPLTTALPPYAELGYPLFRVSAKTKEGLDALFRQMQGKASVFSGQSGVGKSALINAMLGLHLPTSDVVAKTKKGRHTTTRAQLIPLQGGGWCVDTPGIKSFGVWDLSTDELEGYFPEIHKQGRSCRYPNCSHTHEPDCAVVQALSTHTISHQRYTSYCNLLQEAKSGSLPR